MKFSVLGEKLEATRARGEYFKCPMHMQSTNAIEMNDSRHSSTNKIYASLKLSKMLYLQHATTKRFWNEIRIRISSVRKQIREL